MQQRSQGQPSLGQAHKLGFDAFFERRSEDWHDERVACLEEQPGLCHGGFLFLCAPSEGARLGVLCAGDQILLSRSVVIQ